MKLSENFSLGELLESPTARRMNILEQWQPSEAVIENLRALSVNVLQPLRDYLGRPIVINSGYRSPRLNKAVKGARNSQHLKGEAADIRVPGMTPKEVMDALIESGIVFDQAILEFDAWVHVSFSKRHNRKETLIINTGTGYRTYSG